MQLDDPVSPAERSRALQRRTSVFRRAARRRRLQALLVSGFVAAALAVSLPSALAGSGRTQDVRVTGNPHASATTAPAPEPSTTVAVDSVYPREILPPASVPPVSDECSLALTHDADGNASPLLCANGGVNVLAWRYYAGTHGADTLALGRVTTSADVVRAMCSDYLRGFGTNPLTESLERLAAAYYGWVFATDPVTTYQQQWCSASILKVTLRTSPNPVAPGHSLVFTVTVTNITTSPVVGVVARLPLSGGVEWVSWSRYCQGEGPTFFCSMPNQDPNSQLRPGQSATAEITTTVDPNLQRGRLPETVTVTGYLTYSGGPQVSVSASTTTAVS